MKKGPRIGLKLDFKSTLVLDCIEKLCYIGREKPVTQACRTLENKQRCHF